MFHLKLWPQPSKFIELVLTHPCFLSFFLGFFFGGGGRRSSLSHPCFLGFWLLLQHYPFILSFFLSFFFFNNLPPFQMCSILLFMDYYLNCSLSCTCLSQVLFEQVTSTKPRCSPNVKPHSSTSLSLFLSFNGPLKLAAAFADDTMGMGVRSGRHHFN